MIDPAALRTASVALLHATGPREAREAAAAVRAVADTAQHSADPGVMALHLVLARASDLLADHAVDTHDADEHRELLAALDATAAARSRLYELPDLARTA